MQAGNASKLLDLIISYLGKPSTKVLVFSALYDRI